jgi:hypothetical protein
VEEAQILLESFSSSILIDWYVNSLLNGWTVITDYAAGRGAVEGMNIRL